MNPKLRSLVVAVGVFVVGGVSFSVYRREPPGQPVANLRDAGLFSERDDRWVMACPEKITKATRNYLRNNGYGTFTPGSLHRIARVVIQHDSERPVWALEQYDDAGTLPNPYPNRRGGAIGSVLDAGADAGLVWVERPCGEQESAVRDAGWCLVRELVNASLDVLNPDAGDFDGGDEEDETDDALQFRADDCFRLECNDPEDSGIRELRLLADGGVRHMRSDGGEVPWCNSATRRGRVTPPCVIPNCWTLPDGGWDDSAVVDCQGTGPFGVQPGGAPRWRGCNVTPAQFSTGSACYPVECSVVAGDPIDVLR